MIFFFTISRPVFLSVLEQRDIYTEDIVDACIALWMGPLKDNNISLVISGRVIDMIQHSHSKQVNPQHLVLCIRESLKWLLLQTVLI